MLTCAVKFRSAWGGLSVQFLESPLLAVTGRSCQKELDASPIFLDAAGTVLCCCSVWQWRSGVQLEKVLSGCKNCLLQTFTCILAVTDFASFKMRIYMFVMGPCLEIASWVARGPGAELI